MRRVVVVLVGILLFVQSSFGYSITKAQITGFSANGSFISGWYWLRGNGQYAKWKVKFNRPIAKPIAVLCFDALSTNTYNGGPGFNSYLILTRPIKKRVIFKNECNCIRIFRINHSPKGICYKSHGCVLVKVGAIKPMKKGNFTYYNSPGMDVVIEYHGGHHTALKKSSLQVYYLTQ
ncbi:hypothetical protein [Hippea jasoniae]|uniref:hypothetical protein n=1 Tax=Hippea jasoniae TaxID=944479 RepID=UPI0005568821|nr:hypothetical protein [Hippea jasoniae]